VGDYRRQKTGGFALARYVRSGRLDTSFGTSGKVLTNFGYYSRAQLVAQPDGKVVAVGASSRSAGRPTRSSHSPVIGEMAASIRASEAAARC